MSNRKGGPRLPQNSRPFLTWTWDLENAQNVHDFEGAWLYLNLFNYLWPTAINLDRILGVWLTFFCCSAMPPPLPRFVAGLQNCTIAGLVAYGLQVKLCMNHDPQVGESG